MSKIDQNGPNKQELTTIEVACWLDFILGTPKAQTAQKLNIHRKTVDRHQKKVAEFVGSDIDINDFNLPLKKINALALRSLILNLSKGREQTTIAYFKGIGAFIEKHIGEDYANLTDDQLNELKHGLIDSINKRAGDTG